MTCLTKGTDRGQDAGQLDHILRLAVVMTQRLLLGLVVVSFAGRGRLPVGERRGEILEFDSAG